MRPLDRLLDADTGVVDGELTRRARLWTALLAGLGLFLEFAVIRWHAGLFPALAYFKNLSLFSCFLGLGLGYVLCRRRVPLSLVGALLAGEFLALHLLHHLTALPQMGTLYRTLPGLIGLSWRDADRVAGAYVFTVLVFAGNAVVFVPLGQAVGRLMRALPALTGYGMNLLGSVAGVGAFFLLSAAWTPPPVWLLAVLLVLAWAFKRCLPGVVRVVLPMCLLLAVLWLPWDIEEPVIYGPYQVVSRHQRAYPQLTITANHMFQQKIPAGSTADPGGERLTSSYDLPYVMLGRAPHRVLIAGAGAGNDCAAAVRRDGIRAIDAIEIDPVIVRLGRLFHPERPYADPRVRVIVNDARAFFRSAAGRYDLVVFGLLDAHTALTGFGDFRMDTFVYTEESFGDAVRLLAPDGHVFISFLAEDPKQIVKVYGLLKGALGTEPLILAEREAAVPTALFGGAAGTPAEDRIPRGWHRVPPERMDGRGLDVPTDDWPFLYVDRRRFPSSYVLLIAVFAAVSVLLILAFLPWRSGGQGVGRSGALHFFFLGAAFMLVEAKGITELALTFGSTWVVVAAVVMGTLLLAFVGNALVEARLTGRRVAVWYVLLVGALLVGYFVPGSRLMTWMGGGVEAKVAHVFVLTLPMLFASVIFSMSFRDGPGVERALSANLFGAIVGGFVEYGAVAVGYRNLYLAVIALYLLSAVALLAGRRRPAASEPPAPPTEKS